MQSQQDKQQPTNKNNSLFNEVEIIKQLAYKYSKSNQDTNKDNKELIRSHFREIYKVWTAFVKFIRSQVSSKDRMVDTQLIGYFYQKSKDTIEYLISQEFYEAGKFKNKQLPNFTENDSIVKEFKENGKLVPLNEGSIAYVCNIAKNQVHKVLTDFFVMFIELSRKTQNEVVLDLKIGNLHLFKNGEFIFEPKDFNFQGQNDYNTIQQRNIERDDLSVIDNASAIISLNGGRAVSIRSDFMENLSVRTPGSKYSRVSQKSVTSCRTASTHKRGEDWLRYRVKPTQPKKLDFSLGGTQKLNLTEINDATSIEQKTDRSQNIPYPFLTAFIERRTGQRLGKRVKFDKSEDQRRILGQIVNQINEKNDNQQQQKYDKLGTEQDFLNNLRQKIKIDQERMQNDKLKKQLEFIHANEALRQEKKMKQEDEFIQKVSYVPTYFPFTHGDAIEQQRLTIKDIQKQDLVEIYEKKAPQQSDKRRRGDQLTPTSIVYQGLLNDNQATQLLTNNSFMPSQNGMTFVRANNHYPYKVKKNQNMSLTMNGAWQRFEDQLKKEEIQKIKQAQNFEIAVTLGQQSIEKEQMRKRREQSDTKEYLMKQIQQKQSLRNFENDLSKRQEKTTFGPEETDEVLQNFESKIIETKHQTKQDLQQMIKERKDQKEFLKKIEKELDLKGIEGVMQVYKEEEREKRELDTQRKREHKEIWIEQVNVNQKIKSVENIFQ